MADEVAFESERARAAPTALNITRGPDTAPHVLVHAPARALERGDTVDRYVIVACLGHGGMGVVHAAYDPELDRKLAIKLLRTDLYPSAQESRRLLREAQALARLAHPNVVAVHDVGSHAGQVWLAMEFVQGRTLRVWLRERTRGWQETLDVLTAAAQGLAAAHARELLHRDIKPENIMVGDDGRVRVMDFGLARLVGADEDAAVRAPPASSLASALTGHDVLLGTPGYMAPELHLGYKADARSDQFSLCVTLWEALTGERPFAEATAISEGRRRPAPPGARVPAWLLKICERGLASDPGERWPDVQALLAALARGQARARRRFIAGGVALAALACLGGMVGRHADELARRAACTRVGAEISAAWNPDIRARLDASLRATGRANADATASRLLPLLDTWAAEWSALRERVCVDHDVAATLSADLAARAARCLDDQREEFTGLLAPLAEPDAATLSQIVPAVLGMAPLDRCRDEQILERRPPADLDARAGHDELRRELMRLRGRTAAGAYKQGLAEATSLLARVDPALDPNLAALARATLADLARLGGAYDQAESAYIQVYEDAGALRDDELAALAAVRMATLLAIDRDRPAEADQWVHSATMLVRRLGEEDGPPGVDLLAVRGHLAHVRGAHDEAEHIFADVLRRTERDFGADHPEVAEALNSLAMVLDARGEYARAVTLHERALDLRERALGQGHPSVAASLHNLGLLRWKQDDGAAARELLRRARDIWIAAVGEDSTDVALAINTLAQVENSMGHTDAALAGYTRALAIRERVLGPESRQVAQTLNSLAILDRRRGDLERAEQRYTRAMAIFAKILGPEHANTAIVGNNLAEVHRARGQRAQARVLHEKVREIRERTLGPNHPHLADSLDNLAQLHLEDGDRAGALALARRALEIRERQFGPDHTAVAAALNTLGDVALASGALDDAEARYLRALAILEARLGADHLDVSDPVHGLGRVEAARGRHDAAIRHLERALAIREARSAAPSDRAEVRFALARVLGQHGARAPARDAGERALTEFRAAARADRAAVVESWLAGRRPPT